ncbi:MAG: heme exporter protein CcmB, partial [Primorskyibacter sp.]
MCIIVDFNTWLGVLLTLLVGTPTLSFIGAIGVALTVGLQKGASWCRRTGTRGSR